MKRITCSFLIVLVIFFSFPISVFAADTYIYNSGVVGDFPISRQYASSGGTCEFQLNKIYFQFNDNSSDWHYSDLVGTNNQVDLTNYDYIVVDFEDCTMSGSVCAFLGLTSRRDQYGPGVNDGRVKKFFNGASSLVLYVGDKTSSYYIDFGFCSHAYDGSWGNGAKGSVSGSISSVYFVSYSSGGGSGSGGSDSVDLTTTNNLLSDISDTLDDLADDVSDIKSALTNSTTGIAAKLDSIITSNSTINTTLGTINTSLGGKLDTINTNITGLRTDLSSGITTLNTSLGNIVSAVNAVPTGINTRLDSVITYLGYVNEDLTTRVNSLNVNTAYNALNDINSSIISFNNAFSSFNNDLFEFLSLVYSPFIDPNEENYSIYDNMSAAFTAKFTALQNVILYGDSEGSADDIEEEEMKLNEFSEDLDSISSNLDDAPDFIDSQSGNVSSQISLFTQFYNGITGLNVGITSILYFGLIVILIKKVVGR